MGKAQSPELQKGEKKRIEASTQALQSPMGPLENSLSPRNSGDFVILNSHRVQGQKD
jgi:hypothetical protein